MKRGWRMVNRARRNPVVPEQGACARSSLRRTAVHAALRLVCTPAESVQAASVRRKRVQSGKPLGSGESAQGCRGAALPEFRKRVLGAREGAGARRQGRQWWPLLQAAVHVPEAADDVPMCARAAPER